MTFGSNFYERPETQVIGRFGHMGYTFPFWGQAMPARPLGEFAQFPFLPVRKSGIFLVQCFAIRHLSFGETET